MKVAVCPPSLDLSFVAAISANVDLEVRGARAILDDPLSAQHGTFSYHNNSGALTAALCFRVICMAMFDRVLPCSCRPKRLKNIQDVEGLRHGGSHCLGCTFERCMLSGKDAPRDAEGADFSKVIVSAAHKFHGLRRSARSS